MNEDEARRHGAPGAARAFVGYVVVALVLVILVLVLLDGDPVAWAFAGATFVGLLVGDLVFSRGGRRSSRD